MTMKMEVLDFGNILLDEKSCNSILIYEFQKNLWIT